MIHVMPITSREVRLASRPTGEPTLDNFSFATVELADPQPGEVLVRNLCMSVDPYMRGRMNDTKSYVPPFEIGKALQGGAVGRVIASADDKLPVGTHVLSMYGWREAFITSGSSLLTLGFDRPPDLPSVFLAFTEAAIGLGLLALVIAYLPTIYNSFSRREVAVTDLSIRAGTPPTPPALSAVFCAGPHVTPPSLDVLIQINPFWLGSSHST